MLTAYSDTELQLTADVLVIGGGPAAAWAAWAAAAQGVKVVKVSAKLRVKNMVIATE